MSVPSKIYSAPDMYAAVLWVQLKYTSTIWVPNVLTRGPNPTLPDEVRLVEYKDAVIPLIFPRFDLAYDAITAHVQGGLMPVHLTMSAWKRDVWALRGGDDGAMFWLTGPKWGFKPGDDP